MNNSIVGRYFINVKSYYLLDLLHFLFNAIPSDKIRTEPKLPQEVAYFVGSNKYFTSTAASSQIPLRNTFPCLIQACWCQFANSTLGSIPKLKVCIQLAGECYSKQIISNGINTVQWYAMLRPRRPRDALPRRFVREFGPPFIGRFLPLGRGRRTRGLATAPTPRTDSDAALAPPNFQN